MPAYPEKEKISKYINTRGIILVHFPENGHHGCDKRCQFCHFHQVDYNIPIAPTDEEVLGFLSTLKENCTIQICGAGDPLYNYEKHKKYLFHLIDLLHQHGHRVQIVTKYFETVAQNLSDFLEIEAFSFSAEVADPALLRLISVLADHGIYTRVTKVANHSPEIHDIDKEELERYAAFYSNIECKDRLSICFRPNFNFEYAEKEVHEECKFIKQWTEKYGCHIYMHPQSKRLNTPQLWNGRIVCCRDTRKYIDLDMGITK